jgi:hypothetical protein
MPDGVSVPRDGPTFANYKGGLRAELPNLSDSNPEHEFYIINAE